jgi:hypothetical protein
MAGPAGHTPAHARTHAQACDAMLRTIRMSCCPHVVLLLLLPPHCSVLNVNAAAASVHSVAWPFGGHGARVMRPLVRACVRARSPPGPGVGTGQQHKAGRTASLPPPCARSRRGTGLRGCARRSPKGRTDGRHVERRGEQGPGTCGQNILPLPYVPSERSQEGPNGVPCPLFNLKMDTYLNIDF